MKRHVFARYYDFATAPERWNWARLWVSLPLAICLPLLLIAQWTIVAVPVVDPVARTAIALVALAPIPIWLGYVFWRIAGDAWSATRWLGRVTGPSWRSGWRAAWRVLRGDSGKSG